MKPYRGNPINYRNYIITPLISLDEEEIQINISSTPQVEYSAFYNNIEDTTVPAWIKAVKQTASTMKN